MSALYRLSGVVTGVLALLWVTGCGGGASYAKSAPGSPRSYGGVAPQSAPMEAEAATTGSAAGEEDLYRNAPAPMPASDDREEASANWAPAGGAPAPPPAAAPDRPPPPAKKTDATPPPATPNSGGQTGVETGSDAKTMVAPMLVYKANLTMAVYEAKKALDETEKLAASAGGYLVRRDDASITVRVPVGRFQGTLDAIMKVGDVLHRDVSVEDVTAQYTDLAIRLRNAEVVRKRLEELLAKANAVKDALEVERELARVTDTIERMKGQLKLLRELVAFSTITVSFQAQPSDHIEPTVHLPFPWLGELGLGKLLSL